MAALAKLRLGHVVLLRLVAGKTGRAFRERTAIVCTLVACAAGLVCGLCMQTGKLRDFVAGRASRGRAYALFGVDAVTGGAALSKVAVVLRGLLRVTGDAGRGR